MADKPVTREEKYLAHLTGDYTGEIQKPITRKEKYLYELCLKGIGGEISPEEIKNAVNEYLEKNPVKPGATAEQAQQIEQNKTDVASLKKETSSLKEDISNKITKFYASNQGETHLADSDNGKIQDMMLYGKSLQDGTPSPENPVEIKSVVNPAIKICGKNLFDSKKFPIISDRAINTNTGKMYESLSGNYCATEKYIPFPYSGKKISFNASMSLCAYDKDYKFISTVGKNNGQVPTGTMYVRFDIKTEDKDKAQIELSENATTYEPYKEQTIQLPITLNAIPVSSGGNVTINGQQYVADYVDVERGKVIRNILKWHLADVKTAFNNEGVWHINISKLGIDGSKIGLSNMFKIQNSRYKDTTISELYIATDGKAAALNMRGMTDEELKKWLIEKNPEVYNVLTVAEEIPITLEEVSAFKQLMTYYPVTNISVTSEQLDGLTVFNYPISMANGWNYVKQQLNDNRDYIYDMDLQSAEAYVNSEYAVALTELEV